MALTYHSLKNVKPLQFLDSGFGTAEQHVDVATRYLDADVKPIVVNGAAWTGEGQPEAAVVLRSTAAALATTRSQLQAAEKVMLGLNTAITRAQGQVDKVEHDAPETGRQLASRSEYVSYNGYEISALGVVQIHLGPAHALESEVAIATEQRRVESALSNRVTQALSYAQNADVTAKTLFERIANLRPVFTANASVAILAYNKGIQGLAESTDKIAQYTLDYWTEHSPAAWGEVPEEWSAGEFTGSIVDSIVPNPFALAFEGDLSEIADGASYFLPYSKLARLNRYGPEAAELSEHGLTLAEAIEAGKIDGYLNLESPTEHMLDKLGAENVVLEYYLDRYYLDSDSYLGRAGLTDIVEAAQLQAARGGTPVNGKDYLAEVRDLRDTLAQFMRDDVLDPDERVPNLGDDDIHYDLSDGDRETARELLRRLNTVLDQT